MRFGLSEFLLYLRKFIGMKNNIIRGAAELHYNEYVMGEPLNQDTPIECFEAGAQFVINAQKKRNKRNLSRDNSYNQQKNNMDKYQKIVENVEKIITVSGFHITARGDESVGIPSASWELRNDLHFDNQEELEEFRKEIKSMFEFYCGEVTSVVTFEEHETILEQEDRMMYEQHPVRYLVKDKNYNMFMRPKPFNGMYSEDVAECIHLELEDWIKNSHGDDIIPSTSQEYWDIMGKALAEKQRSKEVNGQHYHSNVRSVKRLEQELDIGFKVQKEYEKK
jgi:hypothetical protein